MMKRWIAAGLVSLGLTPLACGGDSASDGGATETGPALEEVPALFAEAFCEGYSECLPPELIALFLGTPSCDAYLEKTVANGLGEAIEVAVANGTVEYHPSRVEACLEAIRTGGCRANQYYPECEAAIEGTVAEGGDCTQDAECVGDLFCRVEGICPGTCSAKLAAGAACERDEDCGVGAECFDTECAVKPGPGDACEEDGVECDGGYFCLGADAEAGTSGTCELATDIFTAAVGATCNPATELCLPGAACVATLEGDALSWTCVERSASGGDCQVGFPDPCPTGEYCGGANPDLGLLAGTCMELPADGAPCVDDRCTAEHVCVAGTCQKQQVNGEDCAVDAECYSERCEAGTCVPDTACAL